MAGPDAVFLEAGEVDTSNGALDGQEVFVCESDLGVGVRCDQTITRIRRQTLLKMISDPAAYNRRVLRSLCFCGGHPPTEYGEEATPRRGKSTSNDQKYNRHGDTDKPSL